MPKNKLIQTCQSNSRLFASTGEHESLRLRERPVVRNNRTFVPDDEDSSREFDRLMRSNKGVL